MPTTSCIWRQPIQPYEYKMMYCPDVELISKQSFIPSIVKIWNNLSPTMRTISQFRLKVQVEPFIPLVIIMKGLENLSYCTQG